MASSPEAAQLTEQYRLDQIAIKAAFLAQFAQLWPLLSWQALDATFAAWTHAVMPLLRSFRQTSAVRAEHYFREFREIEAPRRARLEPVPAITYRDAPGLPGRIERNVNKALPEPSAPLVVDWKKPDKAAERSLLVTGPSELKRRAARGEDEAQAKREGLAVVSGSASRHVLEGGREVLATVIEMDNWVLGWARVTDSDPCAFCAMLASRGPVYRTKSRAAFQPHDGCACQPELVYRRNAAWPGRAREFERLWISSTRGYHGRDAINAFRRAYEGRRREQRRALTA